MASTQQSASETPAWLKAFIASQEFAKGEIVISVIDHRPIMKVRGKVVAQVAPRKAGDTEATIEVLRACPESVVLEETFRAVGVKVRSSTKTLKVTHGKCDVPEYDAITGRSREIVRNLEHLRLCRHKEFKAHYWDTRTGKRTRAPRGTSYTKEATCPTHSN